MEIIKKLVLLIDEKQDFEVFFYLNWFL